MVYIGFDYWDICRAPTFTHWKARMVHNPVASTLFFTEGLSCELSMTWLTFRNGVTIFWYAVLCLEES